MGINFHLVPRFTSIQETHLSVPPSYRSYYAGEEGPFDAINAELTQSIGGQGGMATLTLQKADGTVTFSSMARVSKNEQNIFRISWNPVSVESLTVVGTGTNKLGQLVLGQDAAYDGATLILTWSGNNTAVATYGENGAQSANSHYSAQNAGHIELVYDFVIEMTV